MIQLQEIKFDVSSHDELFVKPIKEFLKALSAAETPGDFFIDDLNELTRGLGSSGLEYLAFVSDHVGEIIMGKPSQHLEFVGLESAKRRELSFPPFDEVGVPYWTTSVCAEYLRVHKLIERLFTYKGFSRGKGWEFDGDHRLTSCSGNGWRSSKLLAEVLKQNEMKCCPYCNADYVYAITMGTKSMSVPLDHFLPQSKFPLFGVSLYNLIPSCTRCNSYAKHAENPVEVVWETGGGYEVRCRIIHPYMKSFHDHGRFVFANAKNILLPGVKVDKEVEIGFRGELTEDGRRAAQSVNGFRLKDVYSKIFGAELRLIPDRIRLSKSQYSADIAKLLGYDQDEVRLLLMGSSANPLRINGERLSKIAIDLMEQIGG